MRLVVVPSDPLVAYEQKGCSAWLRDYYNPNHIFSEVFVVSPLEKEPRDAHGMRILPATVQNFGKLVRSLAPDVIRAYGGYGACDLVCSHKTRDMPPVVVSVHDSRPAFLHRSIVYADHIVCVSAVVANLVQSMGVPSQSISIIPNRVNRSIFVPRSPSTFSPDLSATFPGRKHILHVGRLSAEKNIETLLRALALLPSDYTLVLIGSGDIQYFSSLATSLSVNHRCRWIPSVENAVLPSWYSWADCLCTPSTHEGFGIVFIEAAASGAAIITSNIAPMNEYLVHGYSAHLVDHYLNPVALAKAIERVCSDESYSRHLRLNAPNAAEPFDHRRVSTQEASFYLRAVHLATDEVPPSARLRIRAELHRSAIASSALSLSVATADRVRRMLAVIGGEDIANNFRLQRLRSFLGPKARLATACSRDIAERLSLGNRRFRLSRPGPSRAIHWLSNQELASGGLAVCEGRVRGYPEVTGYTIPTLLEAGEAALAKRLGAWLVSIQHSDGSFPDPDFDASYPFDTGQALRGLLALADVSSSCADAADRAAQFLVRQLQNNSSQRFSECYHGVIPETINLYVLPPLFHAAARLGHSLYRASAEQCLEHYLASPQLLQRTTLTHFLSYEIEALIDLNLTDRALPILDWLLDRQYRNGAFPASSTSRWVCTPGVAQLAVCLYKANKADPADNAMRWLDNIQAPSGGFKGSYGRGAHYFQDAAIPWAAKYYLDAHLLRVRSFMDRSARILPSSLNPHDGRAVALASYVSPGDHVLDVGCGKGRYLHFLRDTRGAVCHGVDISSFLLSHVNPGVDCRVGSLERVPYPNDKFDVVFSIEALEHSANQAAAVKELVRVAKPGGTVVVIDKQAAHWGRLRCPPWERWPNTNELVQMLADACEDVHARAVGYDEQAPDGLMMIWVGRKR